MNLKSRSHPLHSKYIEAEVKGKRIPDLFKTFTPDFILMNPSLFTKIFRLFTPNEYPFLKKYKNVRGMILFSKENFNSIPIEDYSFWVDACIDSNIRFFELEKVNIEYISKKPLNNITCEILLDHNYSFKDEYKYSRKDLGNFDEYLKLACNSFGFLENLLVEQQEVIPYGIKLYYNRKNNKSLDLKANKIKNKGLFHENRNFYEDISKTSEKVEHKIKENIISAVTKIHKTKPNFYTSYILNIQPTIKMLKEGIYNKMIPYLTSENLQTYLFEDFLKNNNTSFIREVLLEHRIEIHSIRSLVIENILIPEQVSLFLSSIVSFLSNSHDWFSIFFDKDVNHTEYEIFFKKIFFINHHIVYDENKINYFMKFSFYKSNFYRNFDPLNYSFVMDLHFLKYFEFSKRKDIEIYNNLLNSDNKDKSKNKDFFENMHSVFSKFSPILRRKKLRDEYYCSYRKFTNHLLETKLGIFYIMYHLKDIKTDVLIEIMQCNKNIKHPINEFLDEYIWFNCIDISLLFPYFKTIRDKDLSDILNDADSKIEFKSYLKYKSYKNECISHISKNYTMNEIVEKYYLDPDFVLETIRFKFKKDENDFVSNFIVCHKMIQNNVAILEGILKDSVVSDKQLDDLFVYLSNNFRTNINLLMLIVEKNPSKFAEKFLHLFSAECTVEEAVKMFKIRKYINLKEEDINCTENKKSLIKFIEEKNPQKLVKNPDDLKKLLQIYNFKECYVLFFIQEILKNLKDSFFNLTYKKIQNNKYLLFAAKEFIKNKLESNSTPELLIGLNNANGYFTKSLLLLTKSISLSTKADQIIKLNTHHDFLKMSDTDMVRSLMSTTFHFYLDKNTTEILLFRIKEILKHLSRKDVEFGRDLLKIVSSLHNFILGDVYFELDEYLFRLLSDDKFTDEIADIFRHWIRLEIDKGGMDNKNLNLIPENIEESGEKNQDKYLNVITNIEISKNEDTHAQKTEENSGKIPEKLEYNDELICRFSIIRKLVGILETNIRISKVLVSVLLEIEKDNGLFVKEITDIILKMNNKKTLHFLAHVPSLKCYKSHHNHFIPIMKNIWNNENFEIAGKSFVKMYNEEIDSFLVDSVFTKNRKMEVLSIFESVINENNEIIEKYPRMFATLYVLRFDRIEKIRRKAFEIWITHFKMGMLKFIMKDLIVLCFYRDGHDEIFAIAINEIVEKYSEILKVILENIVKDIPKYDRTKNDDESNEDNILGKEIDEKLKIEKNDNNIIDELFIKKSYDMKKREFINVLKEILTFIIMKGILHNKFIDVSLEFTKIHQNNEIIRYLTKSKKYKEQTINLIISNELEILSFVDDKECMNEIHTKTLDYKTLPYTTDTYKMKIVNECSALFKKDHGQNGQDIFYDDVKNERNESINHIFKSIVPSKQWEAFLSTVHPIFSYFYLRKDPLDFGGLNHIFEKVFENLEDIDVLINKNYIKYIEDATFKNVKDQKKLFILLMSEKKFSRIKEVVGVFCDEEMIIEILKEILNKSSELDECVDVLRASNHVLSDYIEGIRFLLK